MLEWLKRHAWKACKLQKGFGGSNPPLSAKDFLTRMSPSLLERMSFRKDLHRMPVADCGDYEEIPKREKGMQQRGRCPRIPCKTLAQRATNVSKTNKINYKQFNTKNKIV